MPRKQPLNKIVKEYKDATRQEILKAILQNGFFGLLSALLVVFLTNPSIILTPVAILLYYVMLSIIIHRESYTTILGKYIIFPFSCSLGYLIGSLFQIMLN